MLKVTYINLEGVGTVLFGQAGDSVISLALKNGLNGITGECGGSMMCATCHCYVELAWARITGSRSDGEEDLLDCAISPMDDRSRLGCHIILTPTWTGWWCICPRRRGSVISNRRWVRDFLTDCGYAQASILASREGNGVTVRR